METPGLKWTSQTSLRGWLVLDAIGLWRMQPLPPPLAALLEQVTKPLDAGLYYAALAVVFTLPDICASLEADPTVPYRAMGDKYAAWFDANATPFFQSISGEDAYHLRGGVSHRGQFTHRKSKFDRVVFLIPGSPFRGHDVVMSFGDDVSLGGKAIQEVLNTFPQRQFTGQLLLFEVVPFCETIMQAVRRWAMAKADDPNVRANLERLVHYRQSGLPPLMVGFPVIA